MKKILPWVIVFPLAIAILRRLNHLVAGLQNQREQLEELQEKTAALRAVLEEQRELIDEMVALREAVEDALYGNVSEHMGRWHERLRDLDSLN